MNTTAIQSLITDTLAVFGGSVLAIITMVLSIAVAYLIFRFGWRAIKGSLDGKIADRDNPGKSAYWDETR